MEVFIYMVIAIVGWASLASVWEKIQDGEYSRLGRQLRFCAFGIVAIPFALVMVAIGFFYLHDEYQSKSEIEKTIGSMFLWLLGMIGYMGYILEQKLNKQNVRLDRILERLGREP
jgi:small-conductance mechanosensitive channel